MSTNIWTDVKQGLGAVAPVIGSLLGGPLGGAAAQQLVNVLGLEPSAGPAQVQAALSTASLDQLTALRKVDDDFRIQLQQGNWQMEKLTTDDRANARAMHTGSARDWTPQALGLLVVCGFFALLGVMSFVSIPVANKDALQIAQGALGSAFIAVVAFYFGSSSGSQAKDAMLFNSTPSDRAPIQESAMTSK